MFIFERGVRVWAGEGQRDRQTDRQTESEAGSRIQAVSTEPDMGLELTNREIMTRAEVGHLTDWATQAPLIISFINWDYALMTESPTVLRKRAPTPAN